MDLRTARNALAETLGSLSRDWLCEWVDRNRRLLPLLPRDEATALLRDLPKLRYGDRLEMAGPDPLLLGLRRLEHGDRRVPATWVLTNLNLHLERAVHEPAALQ